VISRDVNPALPEGAAAARCAGGRYGVSRRHPLADMRTIACAA
jgi:hypothetical protein